MAAVAIASKSLLEGSCLYVYSEVFDLKPTSVDRPLRGRQFFEELIRDNLDLGRPDRIQLIFPRKIISTTPGSFRTRVLREGGSSEPAYQLQAF